jgi:hypothetical protein
VGYKISDALLPCIAIMRKLSFLAELQWGVGGTGVGWGLGFTLLGVFEVNRLRGVVLVKHGVVFTACIEPEAAPFCRAYRAVREQWALHGHLRCCVMAASAARLGLVATDAAASLQCTVHCCFVVPPAAETCIQVNCGFRLVAVLEFDRILSARKISCQNIFLQTR